MLNYNDDIEILGVPSGQMLIINKINIDKLKIEKLIKYKRYIIINNSKIQLHGYIFLDLDLKEIKKIINNE